MWSSLVPKWWPVADNIPKLVWGKIVNLDIAKLVKYLLFGILNQYARLKFWAISIYMALNYHRIDGRVRYLFLELSPTLIKQHIAQ